MVNDLQLIQLKSQGILDGRKLQWWKGGPVTMAEYVCISVALVQ